MLPFPYIYIIPYIGRLGLEVFSIGLIPMIIFTSFPTLHIYYSKKGALSPLIVCIEKTSCFYCCLCDIILVRKRKAIKMQLIRGDDNSLRFVAFLLLMGQLNSGCGCGRATRRCTSQAGQ